MQVFHSSSSLPRSTGSVRTACRVPIHVAMASPTAGATPVTDEVGAHRRRDAGDCAAITDGVDADAQRTYGGRKGLNCGTPQLRAAGLNPKRLSERSPARFRPLSTTGSPTFIVGDKFVECLACRLPSIGYNVRGHAESSPHKRRLVDYEPAAGALTVAEAEALLEPRRTEGRKKRRKQYASQRRAAAASPDAPAVTATSL